MKKRVDADLLVDLWSRLGPVGGAVTPHIQASPVSPIFAASVDASWVTAFNAWSDSWLNLFCATPFVPDTSNSLIIAQKTRPKRAAQALPSVPPKSIPKTRKGASGC
jgi:hypothetical protein